MPRTKKSVPPVAAPNQEAAAATPAQPLPPSPAVVALQSQVVELVSKRTEARARLTEAHAVYLMAQSKFQAAESELQGIESEVQYRISLIAQLENRPAATPTMAAQPLQFPIPQPNTMEPARRIVPQMQPSVPEAGFEGVARASANDLRSQFSAT